jgi:hypothetical protein
MQLNPGDPALSPAERARGRARARGHPVTVISRLRARLAGGRTSRDSRCGISPWDRQGTAGVLARPGAGSQRPAGCASAASRGRQTVVRLAPAMAIFRKASATAGTGADRTAP